MDSKELFYQKEKTIKRKTQSKKEPPNLEYAENFSSRKESYEIEAKQRLNITPVNSIDQTNFNTNSRRQFNIGAKGINQDRGRNRRPFVRQTGENNPYDMSIAPVNIYQNQVYHLVQNLYLNGNSKKKLYVKMFQHFH